MNLIKTEKAFPVRRKVSESDTDSITTVLATIKKDLPNLEPVVNFIQNGGDITKVNIDQIQNILQKAIQKTKLPNAKELMNDAEKYFMDPNNK
jgi:hypothetical protein